MSMFLNLNDVIGHVKNIVDSTRCTVCDKADGSRIRFVCGHTCCDDCITGTEGCVLCLTPPNSLSKPKLDKTLSQCVQNACGLLSECQDTFNIDVYRRLRVSEQLKAEKKLFPECIQAPAKYCNKRKSVTLLADKENFHSSFHLGEHISHSDLFKMKKSDNYVQKWLENSESYPRKAFADLNVNKYTNASNQILQQKSVIRYKKQSNKSYIKEDTFDLNQRKRPYSTTSFSLIGRENNLAQLNIKKSKKKVYESRKKNTEKTENDESGIVLDDEPILIEDSQSQVVDKDELALLAVQQADQKQSNLTSLSLESTQDNDLLPQVFIHKKPFNEERIKNVPFYKRACLADCKEDNKLIESSNNNSKDIAITIENHHFITTINISQCAKVASNKNSVHVQTNFDEEEPACDNNKECSTMFQNKYNYIADSLDILRPRDAQHLHGDNYAFKKRGITIDDSDTDESLLAASFLEVKADVHRANEPLDNGILSEVSANELSFRARKKVRCITPDSNNSSEKENCDPNKRKKQKQGKKNKNPKK